MAKERQYERLISFVGINIWGHLLLAMSHSLPGSHVSTNASISGGRGEVLYKEIFAPKSVCIIVSLYKERLSINIATAEAGLSSLPTWILLPVVWDTRFGLLALKYYQLSPKTNDMWHQGIPDLWFKKHWRVGLSLFPRAFWKWSGDHRQCSYYSSLKDGPSRGSPSSQATPIFHLRGLNFMCLMADVQLRCGPWWPR